MKTYNISELLKVKEIVLKILEENSICRNSDKILILEVFKKYGVDVIFTKEEVSIKCSFEKYFSLPSTESIRRSRAEIQNKDNLFLPTDPNILIQRRFKEDVIRKYYGESIIYDNWKNVFYGIG